MQARIYYVLAATLFFSMTVQPAIAGDGKQLAGHVHAQHIANAKEMGRLDSSTPLKLVVGLALKNPGELDKALDKMYDPKDSEYRHFITPEKFTETYSLSVDDTNRVVKELTKEGLAVTQVHPNRLFLTVEGTSDQVEKTFQTEMHQFQAGDRMVYSAISEPSLSAEIIPLITGIVGLSSFPQHKSSLRRTHDGKVSQEGEPPSGGLIPSTIKSAYNLTGSTLTGQGETLALFELSDFNENDIKGYASFFSFTPPKVKPIVVDNASGWHGGQDEVTLDIQLAMAVAPGLSKILVYEGPNTMAGSLATFSKIATDNRAKTVSSSWGISEVDLTAGEMNAESNVFKQMAAQGQTVFVAAGDSGAFGNGVEGQLSVQDPSSQPYVTAVGGTSLKLNSNGTYGSETSWWTPQGNSPEGGGGGISTQWTIPSWQVGLDNSQSGGNKGSTTMRMVPDVSLEADPEAGYAILYKGRWEIIGGTSCAAPIWAAFVSLANQQLTLNGSSRIGFFNPTLYSLAKGSKYATLFHDISDTSTNGYYPAVAGYDLSTGWGSFNGAELLGTLAPANAQQQQPQPQPQPQPEPKPDPKSPPKDKGTDEDVEIVVIETPEGLEVEVFED